MPLAGRCLRTFIAGTSVVQSLTQDGFSARLVIYVALIGNVLVAISKFIAAAVTGSSAMLSEGIHSVVDTTNELLLLYGIHKADARPDHEHPLGYGREVYFWSFVVALLIFTLGAGFSAYEGITHILNPRPIENPNISYVVLFFSMLFEGSSWIVALRKFKGKRKYADLFRLIIHSKDAPTFIVLLEDSAALIGIAIAFTGVYLSVNLGEPALDGLASVLIGITLGLTAAILARETKGLLIGEAASWKTRDSILRLATEMDGVANANGVLSVHVAPEEILVALSIEFEDRLRAPEIEMLVVELERRIRAAHPAVIAVFVKPQIPGRFEQDTGGHSPSGHLAT